MDQARTSTRTTTLASLRALIWVFAAGCTAGISGNPGGTGNVTGGPPGGGDTGGSSGRAISTGGATGPGSATGGSPGNPGTGGSSASGGGAATTGGRTGGGGATATGGSPGTGGRSASGGGQGTGRDGGVPDAPSGATGGSAGSVDAGAGDNAAIQLCVDTINMYRATLALPPLARWTEQEACVSNEALLDSQSGTAHSAFGMCTESAQNECPGWPLPLTSIVTGCLQQMWAEGPGADFNTHGHYINMSSTRYTRVACGFATAANGRIWAAQDFR